MGHNKATLLCALAALAAACADEGVSPDNGSKLVPPQESPATSTRATRGKAEAIARLFAPYRATDEGGGNKAAEAVPEVSSVSFYVSDGDTLLYAFNYGEGEGYTIVSGSTASFPILAQSGEGRVDFDRAAEGDPFTFFAGLMARSVKERLDRATTADTAYAALWRHVDDPDYTYEVTPLDEDEETVGNKGRLTKTGREYIHPYTGLELKNWGQYGDYNSAAPNRACIGCPAVAIGMLLYDVCTRTFGKIEDTKPSFSVEDRLAYNAKRVSTKLREIANTIPNYNWGKSKEKESGASATNILTGLRRLGFTSAKLSPYNFETAYSSLSFPATSYFGTQITANRGILLFSFKGNNGHIWFCDGYRETAYRVTRTRRRFFHKTRTTWTEYEDTLYMNWGWGDNSNGWYHAGEIGFNNFLHMITGLDKYTKP